MAKFRSPKNCIASMIFLAHCGLSYFLIMLSLNAQLYESLAAVHGTIFPLASHSGSPRRRYRSSSYLLEHPFPPYKYRGTPCKLVDRVVHPHMSVHLTHRGLAFRMHLVIQLFIVTLRNPLHVCVPFRLYQSAPEVRSHFFFSVRSFALSLKSSNRCGTRGKKEREEKTKKGE